MIENKESVQNNTKTPTLVELPQKLAEELFDLQEAGRIMHESWTVTKREQGFHHPLECQFRIANMKPLNTLCPNCHFDLIPWDDLPQKQKDINFNAFKDVFAVLAPKSESAIRRAMLEFAERAELVVDLAGYQLLAEKPSQSYSAGIVATKEAGRAAIRELAEGLKRS